MKTLYSLTLLFQAVFGFCSEHAILRGPFEGDSNARVVWAYSPDDRRTVEVHLSAFGGLAEQTCDWMLAAKASTPFTCLPYACGPIIGNKIDFKDQSGTATGSLYLQFAGDEKLALSASPYRADQWTFYADLPLQTELPDLQSWNRLFTVTGPLALSTPGFFQRALDLWPQDLAFEAKRVEFLRVVDRMRGHVIRTADSRGAQDTKAYGKLTVNGFELTALIITLKSPSGERVKYAMVYGNVQRSDDHWVIRDKYRINFRLSGDARDLGGQMVTVEGVLDEHEQTLTRMLP